MARDTTRYRRERYIISAAVMIIFLMLFGVIGVRAEEGITLPDEYRDFLGEVDDGITDKLPGGAISGEAGEIDDAAREITSPQKLLGLIIGAFGSGIGDILPHLVTVLAIVLISALLYTVASYCGTGLSRAVDICTRLVSFCALSGVALSCAEGLKNYFEGLFRAVAAFVPLSAAMYAMGGNLTSAAASTTTLTVTLTVCQFLCTYTVLPIFSLLVCMSLISVFDGAAGAMGATVSTTVRRWYTTAMAFLMMILTGAIAAQSVLAAKADTAAMRGAKFAVSNFVPLFGGTLSGTLGTLSASVELLRGSVGILGIVVIFLMLLPTAIELALMRAVFSVGAFCAGLVGCPSEQRVMNDIGSLYGYLEGVALMCSAVFVIAMGIFAASSTPFS